MSSEGRCKVSGCDDWGQPVTLTGSLAPVHKPLASAGEITDRGHAIWLDGSSGFVLQAGSPVLQGMRDAFEKLSVQHQWAGCLQVNKEKGVYNMMLRVAGGHQKGGAAAATELCPYTVGGSSSSSSGGLRQASP